MKTSKLKAWNDDDWSKPLTERLRVAMVDEDLPPDVKRRKPWFILLTQDVDQLKALGPVRGAPAGKSMLLFESDVVALVEHLADSGLVVIGDDGRIQNGLEIDYARPVRRRRRTTGNDAADER